MSPTMLVQTKLLRMIRAKYGSLFVVTDTIICTRRSPVCGIVSVVFDLVFFLDALPPLWGRVEPSLGRRDELKPVLDAIR